MFTLPTAALGNPAPPCPTCHGAAVLPDPFGYPTDTLPCPVCCPRELHHREWPAGSRGADRNGFEGVLLASTWIEFAWVLFDGQVTPATTAAGTLKLLEMPHDYTEDRGCDVCDEPPPWED